MNLSKWRTYCDLFENPSSDAAGELLGFGPNGRPGFSSLFFQLRLFGLQLRLFWLAYFSPLEFQFTVYKFQFAVIRIPVGLRQTLTQLGEWGLQAVDFSAQNSYTWVHLRLFGSGCFFEMSYVSARSSIG